MLRPMILRGVIKAIVGSFFCLLFLVIQSDLTNGQENSAFKGIPYYNVYSVKDHPGEKQMFDGLEWIDGTILVGNTAGLLQYADDKWHIFFQLKLPYLEQLEHSLIDSSIIWAGSRAELGYLKQLENGEFDYSSLLEFVPENYLNFSRLYAIRETRESVYYFTDIYAFQFSKADSTFQVIDDILYDGNKNSSLINFAVFNNKELFFLSNGDIVEWRGDSYSSINPFPFYDGDSSFTMTLADLTHELSKAKKTFEDVGIGKISESLTTQLQRSGVVDVALFPNGNIALTSRTTVFIINTEGELIYSLNEKLGFPEEFINGVFTDRKGDLWILGDLSLVHVYTGVPIDHFPGEILDFGVSLNATVFKDKLYIAAIEGVHRLEHSLSNYTLQLEEFLYNYPLREQVYFRFLEVDDELWVGSSNGIYRVSENSLESVIPDQFAFRLKEISDDIIIFISVNGLDWIQKIDGEWVHKGAIQKVDEEIYEIAAESNGTFWAGGVNGHVFRGNYSPEDEGIIIKKFGTESGLPNQSYFEPSVNDELVVINSNEGFYQYLPNSETFEPITSINDQLGFWGEFLTKDLEGNLWTMYVDRNDYVGIIKISPNDEIEWEIQYTPFEIAQDLFVDYLVINENDIWVGATESVVHMDISESYAPKAPEVKLWRAVSIQDQEILSYRSDYPVNIEYSQRNVELQFLSTSNRRPETNQYRFKAGDSEWSEWRNESSITLNPFFPGDHIISVQTRDFMMTESELTEFSVTILAPWYLSQLAYVLYFLMFGGLLMGAVRLLSSYRIQQQVRDLKLKEIEKIIELDEMKTKLLINISHELRTPLTLVTGPVKQLLDSDKVQDDFLLHKLRIAHRNGRRLHDLVEQVLDLSRLDSNIVQFNPVEIPLKDFVQRVIESFEAAIEKKSLIISAEFPDAELLFQADADKLEKILVNLVSNAIKFTPQKGQIEIKLTKSSDEIQIQIKDSGRGIELDDLDQVFDRFHSTSDQLEGGGQGIGVGLSITKEFVELHDGSISVESEPGKGAIFTTVLPIKEYEGVTTFVEEAKGLLEDIEEHAIQLSVSGKEYTALVVEDNPDMREYVSELLSQLNIRVEQAENGIEGKKQMSILNPDIVISDIMMPEMNGFEFAQWMRSVPEHKQTPIILLSARSEVEDKVHGFQIGVSDYLTKPFNAQELQARVDNLLVLKKEREEIAAKSSDEEQPLSVDSELVQQLQEFVESKIDQSDISVEDLSNHVAMSTRNLQRTLKSVTGFTPVEFIREVRLFSARDLLETKQKRNISEVAYAIGFSTPAYFSKQYKKRFGTTPSSYF